MSIKQTTMKIDITKVKKSRKVSSKVSSDSSSNSSSKVSSKEPTVIKHEHYDLYMSSPFVKNMVNAQAMKNLMYYKVCDSRLCDYICDVNFVVDEELLLLRYSFTAVYGKRGYEEDGLESMYIQEVRSVQEDQINNHNDL